MAFDRRGEEPDVYGAGTGRGGSSCGTAVRVVRLHGSFRSMVRGSTPRLSARLFTQQSCTRFEGQVVPGPFRHHAYSISQSNKEENMNHTPEGPSPES